MNNIFDIKSILNETSVPSKHINLFDENPSNVSFTEMAFTHVLEMKDILNENTKELYKEILEATDYQVINESFYNFTEKVRELVKKFIEFIKGMFNKFVLALARLVKSEKYIDANKKQLIEFSTEHEFEYEGYIFSFDHGVPVGGEAYNSIMTAGGYTTINSAIDAINKGRIDETIYNNFQTAVEKMEADREDFYDAFRSLILGKPGESIYQDEFGEELFATFRSESRNKERYLVTNVVIQDSLRFFENYNKVKSEVEKTKARLEKEYKTIEKELSRTNAKIEMIESKGNISVSSKSFQHSDSYHDEYENDDLDKATNWNRLFNIYVKEQVNQVVECSNIHALAFSYKLDALKACYEQDKDIIYRAFSEMNRRKTRL